MPKIVTTEEWVARARAAHGDRYLYPTERWGDYTSRSKLTIICQVHGEFLSTLGNHTHIKNPTGCPICADKNVKSREERIAQAVSAHGDKYDYSLWPEVTLAGTRVETLCRACNKTWFHNVDNHVRGRGCPNCIGRIKREKEEENNKKEKTKKYALDEYVERAKKLNGHIYDYSLVHKYGNSHKPQPVICKEHGVFYVRMYSHVVRESKCPQCVNLAMRDLHKYGFAKYYLKLKKIHPTLSFLPHETGSDTAKSRIIAICPLHGEWVTTIDCLRVSGCPACMGHSQTYIYINNVENVCVKYGIARNADIRLRNQNKRNAMQMERILLFRFDRHKECRECESVIKKELRPVLTVTDLEDGWTETAKFSDLDFIINKIKEFGGVKCELQ